MPNSCAEAEITKAINPVEPCKIRSAVYSAFVREGINTLPEKEKEKAKKLVPKT